MQLNMALERATNQLMHQVQECVGLDADEFHVIDAMIEMLAPEGIICKARAHQKGLVLCTRLDDLNEECTCELMYSKVEQMVQEEADDVDTGLQLAQLDFENHAKEEYSGAPALSISQRWHTPTLH